MMTSVARIPAWFALAALLCFVPCAIAQGTVNAKAAGAGNPVLGSAPSNFLAFTLAAAFHSKGGDDGGGNGCGNNGGGGDSRVRANDDKGGGGCTTVPEGGTALTYLLVAGLGCLGAMALRARRQSWLRENQ